ALSSNRRSLLLGQMNTVLPAYAGLTCVLAMGLIMAGDPPFVALCHALSVMSTSGITPLNGLSEAPSGHWGEGLIFVFLIFAISRRWLTDLPSRFSLRRMWPDPELKLALICLGLVPLLLFGRHFISAVEVDVQEDLIAALQAYWGGLFTVGSFLSTFGLESRDWDAAQDWSGLPNSAVILLGLALMGGGIATTAGGVKLLRVYALYKHGLREMRRLVHPNSVGGSGMTARRIRREGAYIAWVFLMLFAMGIAVSMLCLSVQGMDFEGALALSVAALTNTGPAVSLLDPDVNFSALSTGQLAVVSAIMVVGRMETLVFVAFLNPTLWRA
ncbi:MAG: potassium transporter TrkG, partial [Pseudomonadota bacterium]